MKIPNIFKKSATKSVSLVGNNDVGATYNEAKMYFSGLLSDYTSTFKVDTYKQSLEAYRNISVLNTIINYSAKAFIRANMVLKDINTAVQIDSGDLYNVLEQPHLLQSKSEFWESVYINYQLYGIQYTLKNYLAGFGLNSMLSLPTADIIKVLQKKPDYLTPQNLSDIINHYIIDYKDGSATKINDVNRIWTLQQVALSIAKNGYINSENPLKPIKKELGLLNVIADVKEELIGNHGAKGIISPDSKDALTAIPLEKKDKKNLQRDYFQNHGLTKGKNKLIITNKAVKFTSISLKIAELLLNEFQEKAEEAVWNNFMFPPTLLNSKSKYENRDAGNKELYENKIIPESKIILDSFNSDFKLKDQNVVYEFDYSKISYLQTDKKAQAVRDNINTNIVINLNKSVFNDEMSREAAIHTLILQNIKEQDAEILIIK